MSAFGLFLRKYWKELAALALLSFAAWRGYHWAEGNGVRKERMVWLAKENKALAQAIADNAKANDERRKAQKKADELARPQREVAKSAKANPSGCNLAKPTGDKLREQVRATNDAIRSVP